MPNFTPRPDRSLVRALTTADEQLASVFNQSWQAVADNLQLILNNLIDLEQQRASIDATVASIETSFSSQQAQLQSAQSAASPVLAASLQRNSEANSLNTANSAATAKTAAATRSRNDMLYLPFLVQTPTIQRIRNASHQSISDRKRSIWAR